MYGNGLRKELQQCFVVMEHGYACPPCDSDMETEDATDDSSAAGPSVNGMSPTAGATNGFTEPSETQRTRRGRPVKKPNSYGGDHADSANRVCVSNALKSKKQWTYEDRSPVKRGYNGWELCLRSRPAQVQHYQSVLQQNFFTEKKRKSTGSPSSGKQRRRLKASSDTDSSMDSQDVGERGIGEIVWAKLGKMPWWPAITVTADDCGQQVCNPGHACIFWFGDHQVSEIPNSKLCSFTEQFGHCYKDLKKRYPAGVHEAIKECAKRAKKEFINDSVAALMEWAMNKFPVSSNDDEPFAPNPDMPLPDWVKESLERIKSGCFGFPDEMPLSTEDTPEIPSDEKPRFQDCVINKVWRGKQKIEDICIGCDQLVKPVVQHPLFKGGLCTECKENVKQTMYATGDDGKNSYCAVCVNAGELVVCDNPNCVRVYCKRCINTLVGVDAYAEILNTDPWYCYICKLDSNKNKSALLVPKADWQSNVMKFYLPEQRIELPDMEKFIVKRRLRVLSLFDGIGTAKYVMDILGLEVEKYYSCEVDQDAINVTKFHFGTEIEHLGNVIDLTSNKIAELLPIDLVIGGSPCNDLCLVNHARKGLYDPTGTGILFFDYARVLHAIQRSKNNGHHVFWLYENVVAMPKDYKGIISRHLESEPAMIDAKFFSPQNRARYFWGNIPGMYSPLPEQYKPGNVKLESVLIENCDRKALVEKVRSITTRTNSLRQTKDCEFPVTMEGKEEVLWPVEMERVFQFPDHYTDVGNLAPIKRQRLLGRAWSVPVIKYLLQPLRDFFRTNHTTLESTTNSKDHLPDLSVVSTNGKHVK